MAVAVYFHPPTLNEKQYRAVIDKLAANGVWPPEGLLHHSCFGEGDSLMVYDVWETQGHFDKFGETMLPILDDVGIEMGQPMIMPIVALQQPA